MGDVLNVNLILPDGSALTQFFIWEGVVLTVTCQEGYAAGAGSPGQVTCLSTGLLDAALPDCKEVEDLVG